jgi:putative membrane protein
MRHLSEADQDRVTAAVTAAEAGTSGEIVTVIAERSDGYSDVALAWSAVIAFTALLVYMLFSGFYLRMVDRVLGNWGHDWTPREVLALALCAVTAKFLGMMLIQLWPPLKFWLVPPPIKTHRTLARAISLFKVGAERRTTGRTGILIYLSMRERRAQIIADEAIASKVPAEMWGEAMAAMLAHIKDGRVADGMCAAVEKVGVVLAAHFPHAEDDVNELPDRLIEL